MPTRDDVGSSYEEIVAGRDAPTLVLAGPGAGKTYLLADRVTRLLNEGVRKDEIMVLAFGVDAAQHMVSELVNRDGPFGVGFAELPPIKTMHALAFEIVNEKPRAVGLRKTDLRVLDDEDVKRLLFRDAGLLAGFSDVESKKALECKARGDCQQGEDRPACAVCRSYWEIMSKCNRLDFDDQILFACSILESCSDVAEKHRGRCRHLLVDEYQDINAAQFRLIRSLSLDNPEGLFVVGDDAQSVYGFRGASPEYILRFQDDYPGAVKPPLLHSRRCHADTVEAANCVLQEYYAEWSGPFELEYHSPRGGPPVAWQLPSDQGEARVVARLARECVNRRKSILVLAPRRDLFRRISSELRKWGVAHECPASLLPRNSEDRLRAACRFLEWLENPEDSFLTRLVVEELINHGAAKVPGAGKRRSCSAETIANRVEQERQIAKLWEAVDRRTSLFDVILGDSGSKVVQNVARCLRELLRAFQATSEGSAFLGALAEAMGTWGEGKRFATDMRNAMALLQPPSVSGDGFAQLMTMKKAKGLQADVVVIVGLEDDLVPSPLSSVEEEARLFYVSMTRAREKVYLLHAYKRPRGISYGEEITGKQRSRFLDTLGINSVYKPL